MDTILYYIKTRGLFQWSIIQSHSQHLSAHVSGTGCLFKVHHCTWPGKGNCNLCYSFFRRIKNNCCMDLVSLSSYGERVYGLSADEKSIQIFSSIPTILKIKLKLLSLVWKAQHYLIWAYISSSLSLPTYFLWIHQPSLSGSNVHTLSPPES